MPDVIDAPAPAAIPSGLPSAPPPPPKAPAAKPAAPSPAAKPETKPKPDAKAPEPEKKPSAREQMRKEAFEKWGNADPEKPAAPETKPADPATKAEDPATKPAEGATDQPPTEPEKGEKVKPWKLVEEYKARTAKLEAENLELKNRIAPESDIKTYQEKLTAAEKRAETLERELRYTNYQASEEFKTKYQEPYEQAWKRAMSELSELSIDDGQGQKRRATAQDLLELVNLPLDKAREIADAAFGPFANDVMGYRKELRGLFDQQSAALEDAKKNGIERAKQMQEKLSAFQKDLTKQVTTAWTDLNQKILDDEEFGPFFKPREGDEEGNSLLEKGFALADRGFKESPLNPNLKPEERAAIVKRHVAIRNRAAAFGRLKRDLKAANTRLSELETELKGYKEAEPGAGQGKGTPAPSELTARQQMQADLAKLAR